MGVTKQDRLASVGSLQQLGGTRLVRLEEGAEAGVRALEFRTASGLDFGVLVDRAFDVAWCRYLGRSIAWHSPTGFVGPWYREPDGLGFLRSFQGGLLVTCGLDHILFPQDDPNDTYDYPGRPKGTSYGLHGRVSSTPAVLRAHGEAWRGDRCLLFAEGEVRQAGALAENLVLRRRIEIDLDGREISIDDEVTNEGHHPTPHMYLYHINLGAPLLDAASELVLPAAATTWRTPTATGGPDEHLRFQPPTPGFVEQAFAHDLVADATGTVTVAVLNRADAAHPWGISLSYDARAFPRFLQWRFLDAGTYVLGLEPSTNGVEGRQAARDNGSLIMLGPGESRRYSTKVAILDGAAECDGVRDRSRALLAARA